jgi:16S rRNA processing protein RimM
MNTNSESLNNHLDYHLDQALEWLMIGKIVSTQGLKGEVRVQSYSDFPERFTKPGKRWIAKSETDLFSQLELRSGRNLPGKPDMFVVRFDQIDSCDQAESLRDQLIYIPAELRPQLAKNEYHVRDLIGCEVYDHATQTYIGIVIGILSAGNDILEVETKKLDLKQKPVIVLIPFVAAIAIQVDINKKLIEVAPPVGLIDLN